MLNGRHRPTSGFPLHRRGGGGLARGGGGGSRSPPDRQPKSAVTDFGNDDWAKSETSDLAAVDLPFSRGGEERSPLGARIIASIASGSRHSPSRCGSHSEIDGR